MSGSTDIPTTETAIKHPEELLLRDNVPPLPAPKNTRSDVPITIEPTLEGSSSTPRAQPEERSDRIISGLDLIDFGVGGLMPNKVYVIKGGIGVGKSIAALQFLVRGLEHQENGLIVTDQKPENVIAQATAVGFQIGDAIKRGQLTILNPSHRYFDLVESPADVMAIVDELGDYAAKIGAKRLVIDPVYTLINTSYSSHFALTLTQSLLNALEDLGVTTVLVVGDDNNAELSPIVHTLEQNAFGVISLAADQATGGRIMRLSKLRYANSDHMAAHYRILDGRGLINYRGEEGERVADVTQPWADTGTTSRSVLLIGALPDTIRRVQEALGESFDVQAESDLTAGVERVKREKPGLALITPSRSIGSISAILDLAQNSGSSVAFLSPNANRQSDRVLYLRAGADDFITEPFTPAEFRARIEALVRRSGRRLNARDTGIANITPAELSSLMMTNDQATRRRKSVITGTDSDLAFEPEFQERLQRNVETVSKFDTPFALYWIKSKNNDPNLNRSLAKLCRQEDILCHNRNGEFVAILTATDENGIRGFQARLNEKVGDAVKPENAHTGFSIFRPGEPTDGFTRRAFASSKSDS